MYMPLVAMVAAAFAPGGTSVQAGMVELRKSGWSSQEFSKKKQRKYRVSSEKCSTFVLPQVGVALLRASLRDLKLVKPVK
jgi:hypothetical protein